MATQRFKHLKHLKGLKQKLPDIKAVKFQSVLPSSVINALDGTFDLTDPLIKDILDRLGNKASDYPVAVRVAKLQQQFPVAPITELVTYDWLRGQGVQFVYQAALNGGRAKKGGILPDIMVMDGTQWNAWPINGDYWHSYDQNQGQDVAEKALMLSQEYGGVKIGKVTTLWEHRIYRYRPMVFELAMAGIEMVN